MKYSGNATQMMRGSGKKKSERSYSTMVRNETRDLQLSDLAIVLEDLEVIELEQNIGNQTYNVPGAKRDDDESLSKNKHMLDRILEKPSLSELI